MKLKLLWIVIGLLVSSAGFAFGKININTADTAVLVEQLIGVGPQKAVRIVEYRQAHGPFKSVDDLAKVKGIGEALLNKNRDKITVTSAAESRTDSENKSRVRKE